MIKEFCEEAHFNKLIDTLSLKGILQYNYFVKWSKVFNNIKPIEKELHLLNSVIGKEDIEGALLDIFNEYPKTIKAIPALLAIREKSVNILIDKTNDIHKHYNFNSKQFTDEELRSLVEFVMLSGIGELLQTKQIRNLPDYCTGVEVGLDSNSRKNRGGEQMEQLVNAFVASLCHEHGLDYLPQAGMKAIKQKWGIDVKIGKARKKIDYVIYKEQSNQLYFIECNFYGSNGSKLKSTASEYTKMSELWKAQGIEFIWVTDGKGWLSSTRALQDYFDEGNYLLNVQMLREDYLEKIVFQK
jgi:type II restriction enzyme